MLTTHLEPKTHFVVPGLSAALFAMDGTLDAEMAHEWLSSAEYRNSCCYCC